MSRNKIAPDKADVTNRKISSYNVNSVRERSYTELAVISDDFRNVLEAIEKWNYKEFCLIQTSTSYTEEKLFNYEIPNEIKKNLPSVFWNSLEECNLLHYACLFRATRIVKWFCNYPGLFRLDSATMEGVTPLHISAALGDFYTAQYLISNGAVRTIPDKAGRTCFHYAAQTNMETCLVLTRNFIPNFFEKDENDKTIIDYAESAQKYEIVRYFTSLENHSELWIPQNICQLECTGRTARKDNEEQCICGQMIEGHYTVFPTYDVEISEVVEKPTSYFGEIEFSSFYRHSPYIRMIRSTAMETVQVLFNIQWKMKKPSIVLSIFGDKIENYVMKETLKKGIWKSAGNEGTCVWIITDGITSEVTETIGEAVRDFIGAYGPDMMYATAIYPWKLNTTTNFLNSVSYTGNYPAEIYKSSMKDTRDLNLEKNHTHYLFLDLPYATPMDEYVKFRVDFENSISRIITDPDVDEKEQIPICGILISGSEQDLTLLHFAVKAFKPVVIMKGSGGLANVIADLVEEVSESNKKRKSIDAALNQEKISNIFAEIWSTYSGIPEKIKMLKDILENRHLLEIFSLEESSPNELDKKILSCLLSQDQSSDGNQLNISHLKVAISINRCDIAQERVFTEGKKWQWQDIEILAKKTILENKVDFIKLFLNKGFHLEKIVTISYLEYLYTSDIFGSSFTVNILKQGLKRSGFKMSKGKVNLTDIGKVETYMFGEKFKPFYQSHDFQTQSFLNCLERPMRELLIWSLLTKRMGFAQLLWTLEKESIGSALYAANMLRSMMNLTDVVSEKEDLNEWANIFEMKAEGVLQICHSENMVKTKDILTRLLPYYGESTCIELAATGQSIKFIAHRSCQELFDLIWRFTLDANLKNVEFIYNLFFGITVPFLIPIMVTYNNAFYLPINEDSGKADKGSVEFSQSDLRDSYEKEKIPFYKKIFTMVDSKNYWNKMYHFYSAPVVKFSYSTFFYMLYLMYFSYMILAKIHSNSVAIDEFVIVLLLWTGTLALEEVRQAVASGVSFNVYLSDLWNKLDILGHIFFLIGSICVIMTADLLDKFTNIFLFQVFYLSPMTAIETYIIRVGRIAYGFSISLFILRFLEVFSISSKLGPKVIMIEAMVTNDLSPFMAILVIFILSYSVLLWAVTFQTNSDVPFDMLSKSIYEMFRTAFFQIFNDLRVDYLTGATNLTYCTNNNYLCPDPWGVWIAPILLAIFIIITCVIMINLLIAMFSNTYEMIQASSKEYWTLQRYLLIREYGVRPPVSAPFVIVWTLFELLSGCNNKLISNPFRKKFTNQHEKQLIQWEHMRSLDFLRSIDENYQDKKKQTTVVVNRGSGTAGSFGNVKRELESVKVDITSVFKERINDVEVRLRRLDRIESDMDSLLDLVKQLMKTWEINNDIMKNSILRVSDQIHTSEIRLASKGENGSSVKDSDSPTASKETDSLFKITDADNSVVIGKIENHTICRLVPIIDNMTTRKSKNPSQSETIALTGEAESKNPFEKTGKVGKGLLRYLGENRCMHIVISRWKRDNKDNIVKKAGKQVLETLAIQIGSDLEFPFFIVKHTPECLYETCSEMIFKETFNHYVSKCALSEVSNFQDVNAFAAASINEIYRGYVKDFRNTDDSWMTTILYNVHEAYKRNFTSHFLQSFEHHATESVKWVDLERSLWKNPGCVGILTKIAQYHDSSY